MLAIMVILIIIMVLASTTAISLYSILSSNQTALKSLEFKEDILSVKRMLLAASTTYEEQIEIEPEIFQTIKRPALPLGVRKGFYNTLPEFFMKSKNPFGKEYVYCPFGAITAGSYSANINAGPETIYEANTAILTKNGRSTIYVTSTESNQFTALGVIGLIISPTPPFTETTNCRDVYFNGERFIISGGRVETISSIEIEGANINQ
ncbi:hypothetical protein K3Z84_00755 [Pseudomonas aeruginosa]|nr:hypothetical protein [Pseudomonas aeruginosa]